ncbi:hypothetical protein [Halorussus halobius]|uniref:hypothetical protein n=1 Tax=Halorussus halobius TaxID=1710537 RepID=UPI001092CBAB|nr:hypothetical protein [Halorussus halobius]
MALPESALWAGGGILGLAVLYFAASIGDAIFGQPRNGGQFGHNRTTTLERLLKRLGAVVVLAAILYLWMAY